MYFIWYQLNFDRFMQVYDSKHEAIQNVAATTKVGNSKKR